MIATVDGVTANDIAKRVGVVRPDVVVERLKRNNIAPVGYTSTGGRRAALYDLNQVLELYGITQVETSAPVRKNRNDAGKIRGRNVELVERVVRYTFEYYMSAAIEDVYNACERAVRRLNDEFIAGTLNINCTAEQVARIEVEWLYKGRIKRRDSGTKCKQKFEGEYFSQGWKQLHLRKWRQHDTALNSVHTRYNYPEIFESAGVAGRGFGICQAIMLDDRSADSWSRNEDGSSTFLAAGVYAWDVLTGALLWVEPTTTITAQAYIRCIITIAYIHGLPVRPLFFMENARASVAKRVQMVLRTLVDDEQLQIIESGKCELRNKLCAGQKTVAVYNVPHIPVHVGKARGERGFGVIKREYDAQFNALTYQGGSRSEAVQLHVNNQHWVLCAGMNRPLFEVSDEVIPTEQQYFNQLMKWAYTEYLDRVRWSLKSWARNRNLNPTIRDMVAYYSGDGSLQKPTIEQIAYLLYWAQLKINRTLCNTTGCIYITREYRRINIVSAQLMHYHVGHHIAAVPMPGSDSDYLLYVADDKDNPTYIGTGSDFTATTLDEAGTMRAKTFHIRAQIKQRETELIRATAVPVRTLNTPTLPTAPAFVAQLPELGNEDAIVVDDSGIETVSVTVVTDGEIEQNLTDELTDDYSWMSAETRALLSED